MKTMKWIVTVAMVAGMMWASGARAGDLDPTNGPGSTMHTLEEIYQNQATLAANQAALDARLDVIEQQTASSVPVGMVLIPAGDFVMGDTFGAGASTGLHTNTLSAFYMDQTEVTKAKWDEVYGWAAANGYTFDNAGYGKAADHPVHTVNWYDCVKWANAHSEMEGLIACYTLDGEVCRTNNSAVPVCDWQANGYRLPTEAEWEKAARGGGANRRFSWSDSSRISHSRANYYAYGGESYDDSTGFHPGYSSGGYPYTSPAGSFAANGYGLHDMTGSLYEWCWDWYSSTYYASSPDTDPHGPASGSYRVRRGGCWSQTAHGCRVASRTDEWPPDGDNSLGFRLVKVAQ